MTRESLFKIDPANPHAFLGTDRRVVVTEPGEIVDIDEAKDLIVAEATLKLQAEERGRAAG